MSNTILLKGRGVRKEAIANGAIQPGYLVHIDSTGKVAKHPTAGGSTSPSFAVENELLGKEITVAWPDTEQTVYETMSPGDEILAVLAASAAAIVIGDYLQSAGDGTLQIIPADVAGVRAKVTIGAADAAVEFETGAPGTDGNDITVEYIAGTAATATVVVTGLAIVIKSDTTTPGTTDQAADIVSLVNGDAEAAALVVARAPGTGLDAVVTPVAATNLAGGVDTSANALPNSTVARAIEAVDNSGGGTEVFIKTEIV